ncbi:MAG: phosphohistidine phosphatase SixA [Spirochaetota bacterium]
MKLIIARHGEAESFSSSGYDKDRSLTSKGESDIAKIGQFIANSPLTINRIFHSPYLRTRQTAEIICKQQENQELFAESSPLLTPSCDYVNFLPQLSGSSNSACVLIVGHNPDVSFFAARLIKDSSLQTALIFQPGTTIAINVAKEKFSQGQLIWCISPDFLS